MTELVLVLCGAVVKTAIRLWTGDNVFADNLSADLTDMLKGQVSSTLDQRRIRRQFENLEEIVARQILSTLEGEFRSLDEGERNAAIIAVGETIGRAQLTDKVLFAGNLDPLYLENYVRRFTSNSTRDLSWGGTALYDRVLAQCCAYIIEIADKLPRFQAGALTELLERDTQILARIEEVLDRLPAPSGDDSDTDRVATAYRRRIVKVFDRLELFGLDFAAQWYSLSIAYINLKVSVQQASEYGGGAFERWLAECPRLLIDGRAGGGKTTILQWIAVRAARGDFEGAASRLNGYIPFFIRLREHAAPQDDAGIALPPPEKFLDKVAPLLAPEAPSWPRTQLQSGRALILVDGMDEVPEGQRPAVLSWLGQLIELFPDLHYVVTTRPGAVKQSAFDEMSFAWATLEPMDPVLIRTFVDQWHKAMREWQKDGESQQHLTAFRDELLKALDGDRFLSELANTPLLAGLICALNQHLAAQLPRRRGEIFEKALAMFYERDRKRRIQTTFALDPAATYHLLGDLALRLVRGGVAEIDTESARGALYRSSATLPNGPYDGSELYRHLLLRSGLLREPTSGYVDFVHRTFQEYLAAKALVESDGIAEIVKNAADDQWREVVILSAGQANIKQTTELLRGLLRLTWRGKQRYKRRMLAVACLDEIHGADPDVLAAVERVIPELVPPRSIDQAEALSHAGKRLIPHLARVKVFTKPNELRAVVRAAALIGGPSALNLLDDITQQNIEFIKSDEGSGEGEFVQCWPYFEAASYAERILRPIGPKHLTIADERLLPEIRRLPTITNISLYGFVGDDTDLSAIDNVQLAQLSIYSSEMRSLSAIRSWLCVKTLRLLDCERLRDISQVSLLRNLENLSIVYCSNLKDYIPIARLENLRTAQLYEVTGPNLSVFKDLQQLTEVTISYAGAVNLAPLAQKSLTIIIGRDTEISGHSGPNFRPTIRRDSGGIRNLLSWL
jgi:NACHT domain